ncbi:MAG TPA: M10 family metallopeptidase C-terminal domain-containing protein [Allosphingosinicella sp.]|nr:M10 family metallopeptidase C-terminal domain-containing protein [Allosphingosinicella sp.]
MAVFDLATLEPGGVRDVVLSADQTLLYAAMSNGDINVYNLVTKQKIATWHVGIQLGSLSISTDGSFLLAVERQGAANTAILYRVDTATGTATTITMPGQSFRDVEIVDGDTAILTGASSPSPYPYGGGQQTLYNLATGQFSALAGGVYYHGWGTVLVEDKHLTLLAEPGISSGPLMLFDDRTNTIVAQGNNYQTISTSNRTGFNFGVQAISETAGLVLQWVYHSTVLVYDLNLTYLRFFEVGGPLDGMVFDPTGVYAYVYEIQTGYLAKYAVATGTRVDQYFVGTSSGHNDIGYGSQLLINAEGTRITIVDTDNDIGKLRVIDFSLDGYYAGTAGADAFAGGEGNDTYLVNHSGDTVTELPNGGNDKVETSLAFYRLTDNVEQLTGLLASGQILFGNSLANSIVGGEGNDTFIGDPGGDALYGNDGNDFIRGDDGDDHLSGGLGNDTLRGGSGVDGFDGGSGGEGLNYEFSILGDKVDFYDDFANQGVVADLRTGVISNDGYGNAETMVNIESLGDGTAFADTFYGNDSANGLKGSFGDTLHGFGGADHIELAGAPASTDGGDGVDMLLLYHDEGPLLPGADGDPFAETAGAMTVGWKVDLAAGTLRDGYGRTGTVTGIENLTGTVLADDLRGNGVNNVIAGGAGNDNLRLQDGGDDTVLGGAGADNLFLIGSLTAADVVNGGDGNDTLILQGDYAGGLTLTANVINIELISILAGSNTNFGEPGTNRHDYVLTTHDSNFSGAIQVRVNGSALLAGEDFTFDGSAELDSRFVVYGGRGVDTLTGSRNNDIFFLAEERFATGDTVNGGAGYDGMFLRGNYTIDFNAPGYTGLFTNIENLTLTSATDERYARGGGSEFDYNLILSDAIVKPGETLTVSGTLLMASETMIVDASAEADGLLSLFGGKAGDTLKGGGQADVLFGNLGADQLTGNGGADVFRYNDSAESVAGSMDHILDFQPGADKIDLSRIDADKVVAGNQAFTWIWNEFSGTAGELRARHLGGTDWQIEGDTDGNGIADLVILLTAPPTIPIGPSDFIL